MCLSGRAAVVPWYIPTVKPWYSWPDIIGLISLDTYLGECAALLVLQCCLATCTPDALWHTTAYVVTYRGYISCQPYCGHLLHHVCVSLAQPPTLMHQQLCAVLFLNGQTELHSDCVRSICCSQLHLLQLLLPICVRFSSCILFSCCSSSVSACYHIIKV